MADRIWARSTADTSPSSTRPYAQRVDWSITGSTSTPLPADLRPASILDLGTGRVATVKDIGDVVRSAGRHVAGVAAVLPTTDAGNQLVDELLRAGTQGLGFRRSLTRAR